MPDSTYPTTIDTFVLPIGTDDVSVVDHALNHRKANDALSALENLIGTNTSQTTPTATGYILNSTSATASKWTDQPVIATSLTDPLLIGGTGTTSTLKLRSTSGVGTTGADIIFQTGNNGATEAMRILNNGNVGIGTASPGQKLEVNGNTIITAGSGGYFSNNNESVAGRISEAFGKGTTVAGNWNTGIGGNITITSTQFRATALGYGAAATGNDSTAIGYLAAAAGTSVVIGSSATDGGVTGSVVIGKSGTISAGGYLAIGNTVTASGTLAALAFGRNSTASGFGTIAIGDLATAANTGSIVINNGFTAVGDTASNQLIIAGGNWPIKDVYFGYGVKSANAAIITTIHGTSGLGTDIAGSSLYIAAGQSTGAGAGGIIKFQTAPAGASSSTINALVDRMTILANGNVGIGISPTATLHLKAGTATANTAPLKLTSGVNLSTTEGGAIEFDGTHLYFTAVDAGTRYQLDQQSGSGTGTVTTVSVVSANGFAGTVANATTTPAITLTTSITGVLKGNGTAISAATDGTDYLSSTTGVKVDQTVGQTIGLTGARLTKLWATDITVTNAITGSITGNAGTATALQNARTIAGTSFDGTTNIALANKFIVQGTTDAGLSGAQFLGALGTGIVKNTTTTGVLSIAVAGDFPTLNQNTTGSAATLTTPRAIYGNNFDGSAALTQIIASTYGGTGNGFTKFSGPTTAEKTFTLPDATATLLYSGGALGTPSSGTATNLTGLPAAAVLAGSLGTGAYVMDTKLTVPQIITTNNAITASANAATVPVTSAVNTVTNNSAATLTITLTTAGAVDRQKVIVCILDASAVAQTITWVNTENSTVTAPTTSNGSTTLPLTVGFMYNAATSLWRCIASA